MNDDNRLNFLLEQAEKAAVSRDFDFAEKILTSQEVKDIAGPDSLRVLSTLGSLYMKAERFEDALSVFKRINALNPSDTRALNKMGAIYRRMGENEKSLDVLLQARSLGDNSSELLYNLGNTYKEMHSYEDAKKCFMQALDINPNDTLAYNHIGTIEFLLGHYNRALAEYKNGLRCDPNHPFIHFNMARLYRLLDKADDAEREYVAAVKSRPNWLKALNELSSLYKAEGDLEKQSVVIEQVLAIDSKNLPALLDRAEIAERTKQFTDARDFFVQAVAAHQHNPIPTERYARFLSEAGDFAKAALAIESYNEDNANDKSLMLDLADIYLDAGRDADAEKLLKEYASDAEDEARALQLSARLHLERGEKDAARQDLEKILSGNPQTIKKRKELAEQLAEAGLLEDARSQLALYSKEHPNDPASDILLGAIYEQEGNFKDALERYAAVIKREQDNVQANKALALLYQRMGKGDSAVLLAGDAITAEIARHGDRDLSMLQESIRLYEQAARQFELSNPGAAEKNLQALARIRSDLKKAAESALEEDGIEEQGETAPALPAVDEGGTANSDKAAESPPPADEGKVDISSLVKALQGVEIVAENIPQETEEEEGISQVYLSQPKPNVPVQEPAEQPKAPEPAEQPVVLVVKAEKPVRKVKEWPVFAEIEEDDDDDDEDEGKIPFVLEKEVAKSSPAVEEDAAEVVDANGDITEYGILELLEYLKDSLSFLPEEAQNKYRKSRERMILEYLIAKLSGKPGLLANNAAKAQESGKSSSGGIPALSETFSLLANLSAALPDKDFASILGKQAETVQGKLKSLEEEGR